MAVSALHPLVNDTDICAVNVIHRNERQTARGSVLRQQLVLQLPAHGHDLLKQFLHAVAVKIIVCHRFQRCEFCLLPLFVKHFFSNRNFILCNVCTDLHPLLKQFYDLFIYCVDLLTQLCQIFHL